MNIKDLDTNLVYQVTSLATVTGIACLLILLLHQATKETIAEQFRQDQLDGFNQVLPPVAFDNDLLESVTNSQSDTRNFSLFNGFKQNEIYAQAIQTEVMGYAGPITILTGLNSQGQITGVRVLNHTETPGLGDKMEISKSSWVTSFEGLSLQDLEPYQWAVKKDGGTFDSFTGATITPRAIVSGIYQSLLQHKTITQTEGQPVQEGSLNE